MKVPAVLVQYALCRELDGAAMSCDGKPESGGILLGCYRGDNLEVTGRTLPGPSDSRHFLSFVRVDGSHQSAATSLWLGSGGTHTWVGEWHTHPMGGMLPSGTDLSSWSKLSRACGMPMVFALAVPGEWGLFAVRPSRLRRQATRLALVEHGITGSVFAAAG
jgi:integrative and conjugative element protein (TIGR02256 family)